ncbi:coiled-coil domain-containing protein [Thermophilibacter mediterraneus]|uniref:coiled-coil domain-containing protein n=1 Tax=Thermophilibacter mediterraneus TaxID=1871031 RepID=UPI0032082EB7
MTPETTQRARRAAGLAACAIAAALSLPALAPSEALADPVEELQSVQQKIQEGNAAYDEATARVSELEDQIAENRDRIEQIERELPGMQERATDSLRTLYKMQQGSGSLVELLLSADDFFELVSTVQYLDIIQSRNTDAVSELISLADELSLAQASLDAQVEEARAAQQEAADALAQANEARSELEDQIAAQAAAEAAERQAALEAAQESSGQDDTFTTESGGEAPVEIPESPDPGEVDWGADKQAFVSEWSSRIDAYLAGSPLAGQGATFAEAAWEYGVDPRFSPAISMVESSQGRNCFLPHNAWGWGSSSWDSWEEAIWDHVAGLASGYGGQLTYAAAKKYCPPNADHWYASVLANMERI